MKLPLEGIIVLEFCQYLAGPYAGLRLADLGATVIKIERPNGGDACRTLATKNLWADGDSVLFHTINRNKRSVALDLKQKNDLEQVKNLIQSADIITHNFRPGIMDRLGLSYEDVKAVNPEIIYGEVSGYGSEGPWKNKPGQDLLAQSLSGLTWHSGNADMPPIPFGIAVADMICGTHLAQGLLAALVKKRRKNMGSKIEVSLMESIIDLQFEGLTAYLNNNQAFPKRSESHNAHPYLGGAYGIYATQTGYIAIAMGSISQLAKLISCEELEAFNEISELNQRDTIKTILAEHLSKNTTQHWLSILESADYWASDVLDYSQLTNHDAYRALSFAQTVTRGDNASVTTTRCPIRLDGSALYSNQAAPKLGEANADFLRENP